MSDDWPGITLLVRLSRWFMLASLVIWPLGLWQLGELLVTAWRLFR